MAEKTKVESATRGKIYKILCLDIGITTGVAIITGRPFAHPIGKAAFHSDEMPRVDFSSAIRLENLDASLREIQKNESPFDFVFFEEPSLGHQGNLAKNLRTAVYACRNLWPGATNILPGVWKHAYILAKVKEMKGFKTQHEKDAVGLALWVFLHPATSGLREVE